MPLTTCPDCSKGISDTAKVCPACGYPIEEKRLEEKRRQEMAMKVAVQETAKKRKNKKRKIIFGVILAFFLIGAISNALKSPEEKAAERQAEEQRIAEREARAAEKSENDPCKKIKTMDDWNNKTTTLFRATNPECKPDESELSYEVITATALFNEFKRNEVAAEQKFMKNRVAIEGRIHSINSSPMGYPEIVFNAGNSGFDTVECQFPKSETDAIAKMSKGEHVVIIGTVRSFVLNSMVSLDDCIFGEVKK